MVAELGSDFRRIAAALALRTTTRPSEGPLRTSIAQAPCDLIPLPRHGAPGDQESVSFDWCPSGGNGLATLNHGAPRPARRRPGREP